MKLCFPLIVSRIFGGFGRNHEERHKAVVHQAAVTLFLQPKTNT